MKASITVIILSLLPIKARKMFGLGLFAIRVPRNYVDWTDIYSL